ncbi:uncharacterized protein LOC141857663 [Brevipalpus obovatus]|uniref:uncharacterized protein LOC141857663 n=1 Tax=Brevipalpus obovatus TaxID=246614 RepID=UPI003D9E0E59
MSSALISSEKSLDFDGEDSMDEADLILEDMETTSEDDGGKRKRVPIVKPKTGRDGARIDSNDRSGDDESKAEDKSDERSVSRNSKRKKKRKEKEKEKDKQQEKVKIKDVKDSENRKTKNTIKDDESKEMIVIKRKDQPKPIKSAIKIKNSNQISIPELDLNLDDEYSEGRNRMGCCMKLMIITLLFALGLSFAWLWESGAVFDLVPKWPMDFEGETSSEIPSPLVDSMDMMPPESGGQGWLDQFGEDNLIMKQDDSNMYQQSSPIEPPQLPPETQHLTPPPPPSMQSYQAPSMEEKRVERADIMPDISVETMIPSQNQMNSPPEPVTTQASPVQSPPPQPNMMDQNIRKDEAMHSYHQYLEEERILQARQYMDNLAREENMRMYGVQPEVPQASDNQMRNDNCNRETGEGCGSEVNSATNQDTAQSKEPTSQNSDTFDGAQELPKMQEDFYFW